MRNPRPLLRRARFLVALFAVFALVAAACGDDEADVATETTEETDTAADGGGEDDAMAEDDAMEEEDAMAEDDAMEEEDAMEEDAMEEEDAMAEDDAMEEEDAMEEDAMEEEDAMAEGDAMVETADPAGPACSAIPADGDGSFDAMRAGTAADAIATNPLLSTLAAAVDAADLGATLAGDGPFTIFAPVDDAFAAVPAADLEALLADPAALAEILTLHVVAGTEYPSDELPLIGTAETVNGASVAFAEADGGITVDGAAVVCTDIHTSNALIHLIDGVLLPS